MPNPARDAARRRLLRTLAASVVAHLLVLWPVSPPSVPLKMAQRLNATLRERPPLEHAVTDVRTAQLPPDPKPARRAPRMDAKPVLLAAPPVSAHPLRRPSQPASEPATAVSSTPKGRPMLATTMARGDRVSPDSPSAVAEIDDGADANALRQYRYAVSRAVHTDYPRLAVERGWTGTAQVRVFIDGNGHLRHISLSRTSGYALLDTKAQSIIGLAAEATALPAALLGHEFTVDFPVEFRLEDSIAQR